METPEAAAPTKKLKKRLRKVFDCKDSNSDGEAESITETQKNNIPCPQAFLQSNRKA